MDQAGTRTISVRAVRAANRAKGVEHRLLTRVIQLKYRATTVSAALRCGAVKVARSVLDQASIGILSVRAIRATNRAKSVEHRLLARVIQLKYRATTVSAALRCGAVKVARSVLDQASIGILSVRAVRAANRAKAVEHRLTRVIQLEYRATAEAFRAVSAASNCGAVQVARSVLDQTSRGIRSVRAVRFRAEAVEHRLLTRGVQLEYRASAVSAATCGAVQVARSVLD